MHTYRHALEKNPHIMNKIRLLNEPSSINKRLARHYLSLSTLQNFILDNISKLILNYLYALCSSYEVFNNFGCLSLE